MHTKRQIFNVIKRIYEDDSVVIFGEQCMGGEAPNKMIERYAEAADGSEPALLGIDLSNYGLRLTDIEIRGEYWMEQLDQLTAYAEKGGIVTASAHFLNPVEYKTLKDRCRGHYTEENWKEMLTPGTELNKIITDELRVEGEFLKDLRDRGVTVLYRPLHEANGSWFWFCCRSNADQEPVDAELMRSFWKYIYNLYVNEMGLDNLLWVYSPNTSANWHGAGIDVRYYYPGDEYVDIVALDWYTGNYTEADVSAGNMKEYDKPFAFGEFGPNGARISREPTDQEALFNSLDILQIMKDMIAKGYKTAYCMTWSAPGGAMHYVGKAAEAAKDPFFIDLERLNKYFQE